MQAHSLPAIRAWFWCREGCRLFARLPITWMSTSAFCICVVALLSRLPVPFLPGLLIFIANAIFTVNFMTIAKRVQSGEWLLLSWSLSRGSYNVRALAIIGSIEYGLFLLLITLWYVSDPTLPELLLTNRVIDETVVEQVATGPFFAVTLGLMLIKICLSYAPGLAAFYSLPAIKSIVFSVIGVFRNGRAWGLYVVILVALAVFPRLILLILANFLPAIAPFAQYILLIYWLCIYFPIAVASLYVSFKEVFTLDNNSPPSTFKTEA